MSTEADQVHWTHFSPDDGPTRYGQGRPLRDNHLCFGTQVVCNGDDWSYPGVVTLMETLTGVDLFDINDISNMNGGWFPHHKSHQTGLDIDAQFFGTTAFSRRDTAVADRLVDILKAHLSKIEVIWVTMTADIQKRLDKEPQLADGRWANRVIVNAADHIDHFHIRLKSRNP